jgi:hypothetical protein
MEFIGLLLLMITAIIWIAFFMKIIGDKIPMVVYTVFACVFISFPLFQEILVYYVHGSPGISLGYALIALTMLSLVTYLEKKEWKKIKPLLLSIVCFYFALGLYESFVLVYIMACAVTLFLFAIFRDEKYTIKKFLTWILVFLIPMLLGIAFRSVTFYILSIVADIPNFMRGVTDLNWMFGETAKTQWSTLKIEFFGMYFVNAFFYLPIRNYLLSMVALFIYTIVKSIRKKNGWIVVGAVGIFLSPWLLMPIEGVVTTYRANLGLSFACALAIMLVFYEVYTHIKYKWIWVLLAGIIIYNQSFDLNQGFYFEEKKYEYQVELTNQIYYKLAAEYDLTKKIVFIGDVELPETFAEYTHVLYQSEKYQILDLFEERMGITLSKRFFDEYGYVYNEVPDLYLYRWGQSAFDEGAVELASFFAMHGYHILPGDLGDWYEAKVLCKDAPVFPKEGSVIEFDEYIVVKLGEYQ